MRIPSLLLAPLLLAPVVLAAGPTPAPTTYPTTRPGHDREPWVFRCVLDGNARSVVVSLGQHRWVAYDANTCAVVKFWVGDIELTGPVYDYKHGPQPHAKGALLLDRKAAITVGGDGSPADDHGLQYRGYSLKDDRVTFHYARGSTLVDETPGIRAGDDAKNTTYLRTIDATDKGINPNAMPPVVIALPTSESVASIKLVEGAVVSGEKTISAPADIAYVPSENQTVTIAKPGRVVIETAFKAPAK